MTSIARTPFVLQRVSGAGTVRRHLEPPGVRRPASRAEPAERAAVAGSRRENGAFPAGRRGEFEAEALPHLPLLFGLALRLTGGNEADSQDLVQDALVRAYTSWDTYERGTNCKAWLSTILQRLFLNRYRARQRWGWPIEFTDIEERFEPGDRGPETPEDVFDRFLDDGVVEAIDALPEWYRVPLVLSDLMSLKYAEIARRLDLPEGTVKSRLFRARRALRERLREYAVQSGYISGGRPAQEDEVASRHRSLRTASA